MPDTRSREVCLAAADALEGAMHLLDDEDSANVLARLADQWRAEAPPACPECVWCAVAPEDHGRCDCPPHDCPAGGSDA